MRNRGSAIRNRDRCPRRRCGFHAPVRAGCCPGRTKRRAEEPPTGRARADEAAGGRAPPRPGGRPPLPRAERAAQAETGIGVGFPGIGLGGAAARCATFASDGKEHRRCGRPTRNFCTHHTPHRPTGIRCRSAAGPLPASSRRGFPPPSDQRTKKTNSHECKTPYANRPAGGCGDASARARTPCPAKCPAKHNTDNHG